MDRDSLNARVAELTCNVEYLVSQNSKLHVILDNQRDDGMLLTKSACEAIVKSEIKTAAEAGILTKPNANSLLDQQQYLRMNEQLLRLQCSYDQQLVSYQTIKDEVDSQRKQQRKQEKSIDGIEASLKKSSEEVTAIDTNLSEYAALVQKYTEELNKKFKALKKAVVRKEEFDDALTNRVARLIDQKISSLESSLNLSGGYKTYLSVLESKLDRIESNVFVQQAEEVKYPTSYQMDNYNHSNNVSASTSQLLSSSKPSSREKENSSNCNIHGMRSNRSVTDRQLPLKISDLTPKRAPPQALQESLSASSQKNNFNRTEVSTGRSRRKISPTTTSTSAKKSHEGNFFDKRGGGSGKKNISSNSNKKEHDQTNSNLYHINNNNNNNNNHNNDNFSQSPYSAPIGCSSCSSNTSSYNVHNNSTNNNGFLFQQSSYLQPAASASSSLSSTQRNSSKPSLTPAAAAVQSGQSVKFNNHLSSKAAPTTKSGRIIQFK